MRCDAARFAGDWRWSDYRATAASLVAIRGSKLAGHPADSTLPTRRTQRSSVVVSLQTPEEPHTNPGNVWSDRPISQVDARRRKSRDDRRKALALLAWRDDGLPMVAIAAWMGVTEVAVSKIVSAARVRLAVDPAYRYAIERVLEQL